MKSKFPLYLSLILFAVYIWSAINPHDRSLWYVEISSVFLVHAVLILTYRKFTFSNMGYFIIALWLGIHTVGAHYSFGLTPFGWITDTFGFERNNYDRLAHFVIGINSFLAAEYFFKTKKCSSIAVSAFVGILFIMAMANAWELIEWIYAEIDGGDVGLAFLGSQGDIWDAQKDMLADTLGAILGSILFMFFYKEKQIERIENDQKS